MLLTNLYCGKAQANITNVIPIDPAKAKLTNLYLNNINTLLESETINGFNECCSREIMCEKKLALRYENYPCLHVEEKMEKIVDHFRYDAIFLNKMD